MNAINEEQESVVVVPSENIVADKAERLRVELLRLVCGSAMKVVIDMGKVNVIDSMGIGVLITAYNSLRKSGGSLRLVNASADIRRMLSLMRLDKHFEMV